MLPPPHPLDHNYRAEVMGEPAFIMTRSLAVIVLAPARRRERDFYTARSPPKVHLRDDLGEHVRRGREGGRAIYEPDEQITARIEATIDTLINELAEAWTHSQGIGHPKYGAP